MLKQTLSGKKNTQQIKNKRIVSKREFQSDPVKLVKILNRKVSQLRIELIIILTQKRNQKSFYEAERAIRNTDSIYGK